MFRFRQRRRLQAVVQKLHELCADLRRNPSKDVLTNHPLLLRHRAPHVSEPAQVDEFRLGNELGDLEIHLHATPGRALEIRVVGTHRYTGFWLVTTATRDDYLIEIDRRKPGDLAETLLEEFKRHHSVKVAEMQGPTYSA